MSDKPFRFLDDAEFSNLGLAQKRAYISAALKQVIHLNTVIGRQIHDIAPEASSASSAFAMTALN